RIYGSLGRCSGGWSMMGIGGSSLSYREEARIGRGFERTAAVRSEPAEVEAAIDVDHLAGAEGEVAGGDGNDRLGDILGRAPSLNRSQALLLDHPVILTFDGLGHVGLDNPGPDLVH